MTGIFVLNTIKIWSTFFTLQSIMPEMAMTAVIVDYTFKMCFLTFYILQAEPLKCRGNRGNLPPTLPFDGLACVNNALINALKN